MANWKAAAEKISWQTNPFIDGQYRESATKARLADINPATGAELCRFTEGSAEDVDRAVASARHAYEHGDWGKLSPGQRKAILLRFADLIVEHKNTLALLDSLEMGKPISLALMDAGTFAPDIVRSAGELTDKLYGASAQLGASSMTFNVYEPRGVVGAITPWNFPVANAVIKIGPALAAGNTMVLKPSELSPSSALKLAELAIEAGLPKGVLNIVPGLGTTAGAALALHRDVDLLTFTGSTLTGRKLMELAGQSNAKPLLLECGGKSPHIVFEDIENLDFVAKEAVHRMFWNQGQVCSALTRLIVHHTLKDPLLEKVIALTRSIKPGDPLDEATTFGPLASAAQRDRVKRYIDLGLSQGARAVLGGADTVSTGPACFVAPTIFDQVRGDMTIAREEIFGPVLSVLTFSTEEEALALANGTDYGLAASVWTQNMGRAKRMAAQIKAGNVTIRTSREEGALLPALSRAPQKGSGFGSESGLQGLQAYSTLKAVTMVGA